MTQLLKNNSHATGPMGRQHDPKNSYDIEIGAHRQCSRQLEQGIGLSATGTCKPPSPSMGRTGGNRLNLTGPSPRS
jgi:hypothetical protein